MGVALVGCSSGAAPSSTASVTGTPTVSVSGSPGISSASARPSESTPSATSSSASPSTASPTTRPGPFSSSPVSGGDSGTGQSRLQTIAVGSHTGYDRLVLTFGSDRVPEFTVTPQRSAKFAKDPSDDLVTLRGQSGVRVVLRSTLLAPSALVDDMRSNGTAIREVQQIGNFEAVVSYAVGVAGSPALVRVSTLTSPNRLVIDVAWPSPE